MGSSKLFDVGKILRNALRDLVERIPLGAAGKFHNFSAAVGKFRKAELTGRAFERVSEAVEFVAILCGDKRGESRA